MGFFLSFFEKLIISFLWGVIFFFCFVFFFWLRGGGGAKWSDLLKTLEGEGLNHNILY